MDGLRQDLRDSFRALRKQRGFTIAALLTLALGVGANTAIFSLIDAVMLKPLPYPHADRMVSLWERRPTGQRTAMSTLNYLDYAQTPIFERVAASGGAEAILTDGGPAESIGYSRVSPAFFDILGTPAWLGRTLVDSDDAPGRDHVVVLSYQLWASRFGADATLVGRSIHLDRMPYVVVGIMPARTPYDHMLTPMWVPVSFAPAEMTRNAHWLFGATGGLVGVLKPGITIAQARARLSDTASRLSTDYPASNHGWGVIVEPYSTELDGSQLRASLTLLFAAVAAILLIGCVNLANLMLARGIARRREVAVRLALGAPPWRLVRQSLVESLMLSLAGGAMGVALGQTFAQSAMRALDNLPLNLSWLPLLPPPEAATGLDARVLFFSAALCVACSVMFGAAPAFNAIRTGRVDSLNLGHRGSGDQTSRRLRNALVVAEVALACVLLSSAGLLIRSVANMRRVDMGFNGTNVLTAGVSTPAHHFSNAAQLRNFLRDLTARLEALPGVQSVAFTDGRPLQGVTWGTPFQIVGHPERLRSARPVADHKTVTPSYFSALQLHTLRGRALSDADRADAPHVVVINETLALTYFGAENPVGKHVHIDNRDVFRAIQPGAIAEDDCEIVGVVANEQMTPLDDRRARPVIYVAQDQAPDPGAMDLVIRTAFDPAGLERSLRAAVAGVDADVALSDIQTADALRSESFAADRLRSWLLMLFAAVAVLLAGVGIYGVISYSVGQRRHELGIRAALGASTGDVVGLVVGGGMRLVAAGLAIGGVAALGVGSLLRGLLFGVNPTDVVSLSAAVAILGVVSLSACYIPGRRAARLNPLDALRAE